jgi:hypothetical protein
MKNSFKTILLLIIIASGYNTAIAGTVAVTMQTHSIEGLTNVTSTQTSNSISYNLGSAYIKDDSITFTFVDDVMSNTTFPSQISVDPVDSATAADAIAGMVIGIVNSNTTSVVYRVTSIIQPDDTPGDGGTEYSDRTTIGANVVLGSVNYLVANAIAGINVTVSSETSSGGVIDNSGTLTAAIAEAKSQFGTADISSSLDAVIDVAAERKAFTPTGTDAFSFTITNPNTSGWLNLATLSSTDGIVFTLTGQNGKMTGLKSTDFATSNDATLAFTEDTPALTINYGTEFESGQVTFTPPGDIVLSAQSFTGSVTYNYTSAGGTVGSSIAVSNLAAGAWSLNGTTVVIPYMPYSDNASQILYITNTGTTTGDILVTAQGTSGNSYDLGVIAVLPAGNLVKLATLIRTGLASHGFTSGKLTLTVTAQVPKTDVIVFASYNVGGSDRGFVNTSQYINND